ncbi:iron dependent repressor, metal binding and dimerization domain protein [uncultured Sphaerochaeta sp.]|uniref:metal-dependent transcriptional regulator n=1 Tax=uncultured Sphaerochaeta sp. TaxID=886478 RepID=UPI002A0A783A|nr:iron dependent repressor, metal binding and dimerization domain protein [uncultured Sphaerochaeta sp.]
MNEQELTPSLIDYLLLIYQVRQEQGNVKAIDIANRTGYTRASVFRAVKLLEKQQLLTVGEHHWLQLTSEGSAIANRIYQRYRVCKHWLEMHGVSSDKAEQDARKLGEVISEEALECIGKNLFSVC